MVDTHRATNFLSNFRPQKNIVPLFGQKRSVEVAICACRGSRTVRSLDNVWTRSEVVVTSAEPTSKTKRSMYVRVFFTGSVSQQNA